MLIYTWTDKMALDMVGGEGVHVVRVPGVNEQQAGYPTVRAPQT